MIRLRAASAQHLGLLAAVLSAAFFATSGPVAKSLLATGWSSGAVVLVRVAGATVLLLPSALRALHGRWHLVRDHVGLLAAYGCISVAGCQVTYFYALQRLTVGVALLLEYVGILVVVTWVCLRRRALPGRLTGLGMAVALTGLMLVLDVTGQSRPDPVGVGWGLLAALGLAVYYLIAAHDTELPAIGLAGLGMALGAGVLAVLGAVQVLPMSASAADIELGGRAMPWWVGAGELALFAAALAYLLGVLGARRLGSTVASFVGLTEVLFAVFFAWALLGELPTAIQLAGGILVLAGVVAVRLGEARSSDVAASADLAEVELDFVEPQRIA